jgi:hypothetical protein
MNLASSYWGGKAVPGEPFVYNGERVSTDHSQLIAWLKEHHYSLIKTNYWIGYRIAFETKEEIRFVMFEEPYQIRIPEYQQSGQDLTLVQTPLVLVPSQAKIVRTALQALNIPFEDQIFSGYVVITCADDKHFKDIHKLKTLELSGNEVSASPHGENAALAVDHNNHTRWGSGAHQQHGMQFTITPKEPIALKGIRLDTGDWPHDFPRLLKITAITEDGSTEVLLSEEDYTAIRYLEDHEKLEFRVTPARVRSVTLHQQGSHPVFDWSIAEFSLLVD